MIWILRASLITLDFLSINVFLILNLGFIFSSERKQGLFLFLFNIWWIIISKLLHLYEKILTKSSEKQYYFLIKGLILFFFVTFVRFAADQGTRFVFSEPFFVPFFQFVVLTSVMMLGGRILIFLYRRKIRKKGSKKFNTVVVGSNNFSANLQNVDFLETMNIWGTYNIDAKQLNEITENRYDSVQRLFQIRNFKNVIICDNALEHIDFDHLIKAAARHMIRIYVIPDLKGVDLKVSQLVTFNGVPIIKSMSEPLEEVSNRIVKRIFDVIVSFLVIVFILSWLIPIIGLLIYLENPGPIFFKQKRSGYLNKEFNCFKFRSMKVNSESDFKSASKSDSRITKTGAWLRKTSIDELPQFINVFIGDMSIIGPRPHMLSQTETYSDLVKKYMIRHFVKPGISGWAQVMGSRGEIRSLQDMEDRIEKDIWYIHNWSLILDIKIIFLTVYNIVKGDKQAY